MTSPITLFTQRNPYYYLLDDLYNPVVDGPPIPGPGGTVNGKKVPEVGALVKDNDSLYWVDSINLETFIFTLRTIVIPATTEIDQQVSVVSYKNDIFRVFYDTRTNPVRLQPDTRCVVYGTGLAKYRIIKNKGTVNEKIISQYYDTDGNFTDNRIPLIPILTTTPTGVWALQACHTRELLVDNESLTIEIFNDHGAEVATITAFTQRSVIMNESPGYRPIIVDFKVESTQKRSDNEIYLFENQDPQSLMIRGRLIYDDGTERDVDVDNYRCFVYGISDLIASWSGLQQPVTVKYYLTEDQPVSSTLGGRNFITATANIVVVPNELASGVKISIVPIWRPSLARYILKFFSYTTDRDSFKDVSAYTTLTEINGTGSYIFDGTQNGFGQWQSFTINVNMTQADPDVYSVVNGGAPVIQRQTTSVKINPPISEEKYLLRDRPDAAIIYGANTLTDKRPVIKFDTTRQQYFIPTNDFSNEAKFLKAFYANSTPPYLANTETGPLVPTHFSLRDVENGIMLTPTPVPLEDYNAAFNITGTPAGRLVDKTVIVEFLRELNSTTTLILFGAPVDVYLSTGGYVG